MKLELLDRASLTQTVAAANTPAFLYKRLRQDGSVERFSKTADVTELLGLVEQIAHKDRRTFEDNVVAYGALVAATFKPSDEIRQYIKEHGFPRLPWAKEILESHLLSAPETRLVVITLDKAAKVEPSELAVNPSAGSAVYQRARPTPAPPPRRDIASNTPPNRIIWNGGHND